VAAKASESAAMEKENRGQGARAVGRSGNQAARCTEVGATCAADEG